MPLNGEELRELEMMIQIIGNDYITKDLEKIPGDANDMMSEALNKVIAIEFVHSNLVSVYILKIVSFKPDIEFTDAIKLCDTLIDQAFNEVRTNCYSNLQKAMDDARASRDKVLGQRDK